jgi:hypothetical protein
MHAWRQAFKAYTIVVIFLHATCLTAAFSTCYSPPYHSKKILRYTTAQTKQASGAYGRKSTSRLLCMARHSAVEEKIVEKYLEAFPSYKRESCLSLYVGKALKECHAIYPQHRLSTHISLNVKKSPFFHHSTAKCPMMQTILYWTSLFHTNDEVVLHCA